MAGTGEYVSVVDRPVSVSSGRASTRSVLQGVSRSGFFDEGIPGIALLAGPAPTSCEPR